MDEKRGKERRDVEEERGGHRGYRREKKEEIR